MKFEEHWQTVNGSSGNKKGYKKGYKDGYHARENDIRELTNMAAELIKRINPILTGGYDLTLKIENLKEKYKL